MAGFFIQVEDQALGNSSLRGLFQPAAISCTGIGAGACRASLAMTAVTEDRNDDDRLLKPRYKSNCKSLPYLIVNAVTQGIIYPDHIKYFFKAKGKLVILI